MIRIYPSVFSGTIKAPASKDYAQRALFMAAVADGKTTIYNVPACTDIDVAIGFLKELGCEIERIGSEVSVWPFPRTVPVPTAEYNFRESGTTARFALALAGALGIKLSLRATGTLLRRKSISLISRMVLRGVRFSGFSLPLSIEGRLDGGEFVLEGGEEDQQFASALLIALPLLLDTSTVSFMQPPLDRSFIDITVKLLRSFGIEIEETENGYIIPGRQTYRTPGSIRVENDWGLAAMWQIAGAASGARGSGVTITDLPASSSQLYRDQQPNLSLVYHDFTNFNINLAGSPELMSIYAALAVARGACMDIEGVPQLKGAETNRLKTIAECARELNTDAIYTDSGVVILGEGNPSYGENDVVDTLGDPWAFMAFALSAPKLAWPIILKEDNTAEKIYADFLKDYTALGGKYEIVKQ